MGYFSVNNICPITTQSLKDKGHKEIRSIIMDNHFISYSSKIQIDTSNFVQMNNGDFIIGTGTFFFHGKFYKDALHDIYEQFDDCPENILNLENDIYGHYAFLIRKNNKLYVFCDRSGTIRVIIYKKDKQFHLSTSMVSIMENVSQLHIDEDKLSLFALSWADNEIPFLKNVSLLSPDIVLNITDWKYIHKLDFLQQCPTIKNMNDAVNIIYKELIKQGSMLHIYTDNYVGGGEIKFL